MKEEYLVVNIIALNLHLKKKSWQQFISMMQHLTNGLNKMTWTSVAWPVMWQVDQLVEWLVYDRGVIW